MSLLWLAPSQAFFAPRLTRMVVEGIVRPALPMFGMSKPILSLRTKLSALRSKAKSCPRRHETGPGSHASQSEIINFFMQHRRSPPPPGRCDVQMVKSVHRHPFICDCDFYRVGNSVVGESANTQSSLFLSSQLSPTDLRLCRQSVLIVVCFGLGREVRVLCGERTSIACDQHRASIRQHQR
jgi:hypothetical protein